MTPERLFDEYHQAVFRFVYRLTRRQDLAEDLTQECFLACIRAPQRFDSSRAGAKTYLFAIARNLVLKQYRDHRADAPLEENALANAAQPHAPELSIAVETAIAALPHLQQEALILFTYEGCTLEEIARVTGTEVGTVKNRLFRARENLKRALSQYKLAPYKQIGDPHGTA
jgi:RNA polymerase sigma-70 factor (ECF subfamily)